jgi:hypothetical protein
MLFWTFAAAALTAAMPAAAPQSSPPPPRSAAPASTSAPASDPQLGYLTAGVLADRCTETSAASISYCFAYVAAVHDTIRAYEIWLNQHEFCTIGRPLVQADVRRAFVNYLLAYPSNRSGLAASVIVVALKETYPCLNTAVPTANAKTPAPKLPAGAAAPLRKGR